MNFGMFLVKALNPIIIDTDSKWAGTEYEGIFDDHVLSLVPFDETDGWFCDNYYRGDCNRNDNFKTYYDIKWNTVFDNAYNNLKQS